jgi:hypothetical protein
MKLYIFWLFAWFLPLTLIGQSVYFKYIFNQNGSDFAHFAIETPDSSFLIAANQWGLAYPRQCSIIKLNKKGELLKTLNFQNDTAPYNLNRIIKTSYGYLSIGGQNDLSRKYYLWLVKMDNQLNILSNKIYLVPNVLQELIADTDRDSNVIIGGSISYLNYYTPRLFGAKVTKNGDLSYLKYHYPLDTGGLTSPYIGYFDYMITMKDSARHIYFDGYKMVTVDSNFNLISKIDMPFIPDFSYAWNPTVLRLTDTTYYVAGEGRESSTRTRTLYFSEISLSGRYKNFTILGLQDTFEHVATQHCLDTTKNGDIYVGSTFNFPISCQHPPLCNDTAYFVLQKLDKQLNTLWKKRYGKDGMFIMFGLLATSDGGCLMYGQQYLHATNKKSEAIIIKIDGNGVITSTTSIPLSQSNIIAYPNPSNGQLRFKKEDPSVSGAFEVNFFDISGKLVFQKKETDLSETMDLNHLATGDYIYQIKQKEQIISIGKWVKIE